MWQRFTERARKIVFYAQEEAGKLGENYVSTEHLLLGLVRENDSVAARILDRMGVNLGHIRSEIERQVARGEGRLGQDLQLTPRAKRVIDLAYDEARQLDNNYIGTEHLLLGMIQEGEGLAGRVLNKLGVDLDRTRREVMDIQSAKSASDEENIKAASMSVQSSPTSRVAMTAHDLSEKAALPTGQLYGRVVYAILQQALRENVRDIHIEPGANSSRVCYRKKQDGKLKEVMTLPLHVPILPQLQAMGGLRGKPPQEWQFSVEQDGIISYCIARTFPTAYGDKVIITVLAEGESAPVSGQPSQRMAPPPGLSPLSDILTEHRLRGRDILGIEHLTQEEILLLLDVAERLKAEKFDETQTLFAKGQTLAMLFEKPSLRTRVTFEAGMTQLGGHAIYLEGRLGVRETVPDVARNLERWVDGIMARTFDHKTVTDLAECAAVPVVNGLSDREHPCQALADFQTLQERKGMLDGLKLAYVGDGNNVAHSLCLLAAKVGTHFSLSCPEGYEPAPDIWAAALGFAQETGAVLTLTHDPAEGVNGADAVYTDVWASMGQEDEAAARARIFAPFQVNTDLMSHAKADALVLHCLPAHRGEEISADVLDGPQSVVFDQAENRLHAQKAVLSLIL